MIILDMNQIILQNLFSRLRDTDEIEEEIIRHLVINSIRMFRTKFHKKYGEIVLAYDGNNYWRKEAFPHYKGLRKARQKKDGKNWNKIFGIIDKLRDEIRETFPYKTIRLQHTEADDVIAVLTKKYHTQEDIMIVSSDKDFQQLQRYPNVHQYTLKHNNLLVCENPEEFLIRHIIKGDSSDGIPNILSDDDTFMNEDKRQKPCGKVKIAKIAGELDEWTDTDNWKRNQMLVDFNFIPDWVDDKVMDEWDKPIEGDRSKLFDYFIQHQLKNLMENLQEF